MLSDYRNSTHYVIDIETLGTKPGCPILQIGVVQVRDGEVKDTLLVPISIDSCQNSNLWKIDDKTIEWWLSEHPETFVSLLTDSIKKGKSIGEALVKLIEFCDSNTIFNFFWSKHPAFDFPILEKAFKACRYTAPWKYWEIRDIATLEDKLFLGSEPKTNSHNALDDAVNEAITLIQAVWSDKDNEY